MGSIVLKSNYLNVQKKTASFPTICLLVMIMVSVAGCASAPPLYKKHPELSQRNRIIKTVGLLPPVISMNEYQASLGVKLVPKDEWSPAAAGEITKAFIGEMAATSSPLVVIGWKEEQDLDEMVELFGPVEFCIQQHAYEKSDRFAPPEPFPEKVRFLEYSLGPAREAMARKGVDAVWIVRGFNNVPTIGAQVKEGVEFMLSIVAAIGMHPTPTTTVIRINLSLALVDKDGTILFYNTIDSNKIGPSGQEYPDQPAGTKAVPGPGRQAGREYGEEDLRNPRVARQYIKALLSDFRTEAVR